MLIFKCLENGKLTIDIIEGCIQNNRKAQERLYKEYYSSMVRLCMRYTKNEEDAVEVLNNGFLKVFKNIQRYEPGKASLYTWIRTIVINCCLDFIKSKQNKEPYKELDETVHIPSDVIGKIKADELLRLIRRLPPATQAVFNLYVIEGYGHKEIGELLSISEGTSKWHLSEARFRLQKMIQLQEINNHG